MKKIGRMLLLSAVFFALVFPAFANGQQEADGNQLALWHYESENGAMGKAWKVAMEKLKEKYPDLEINFEEKGFEQIRQTASMVLNSSEAPDVMEYNKGNATAGLLSSQGLLTDLSDVAKERGWDKILGDSITVTARYKDGIMGDGDWYGVTNYGEYVMVYYNKDMFAEYGLDVPKTFSEFEEVMAAFAAKGITPLAVAGAEYPAQQVFYELVLSQADEDFIKSYQLFQGDVDFHGPEFTFAANKMVEWIDNGYISADAVSMKAEDMGLAYTRGEYPMMISGSWWYGRFVEEITEFDWGIFNFPGNKYHPGSSGNLWVVPTSASNKEIAYDFIDITLSPEIQNILGNAGGIPVNADLNGISDPKIKELIQGFNDILDADGLAFYPDWPVAGFYDVLVAKVQDLMGKTKSADQVLTELGEEYHSGL
ncbi:MAG: extracellular solute-binding protein [Spirochaetales bacterium]|nr:extracellular solute-binding protein [Spirochaetales bacterium]